MANLPFALSEIQLRQYVFLSAFRNSTIQKMGSPKPVGRALHTLYYRVRACVSGGWRECGGGIYIGFA
jgi:hypothetical protein